MKKFILTILIVCSIISLKSFNVSAQETNFNTKTIEFYENFYNSFEKKAYRDEEDVTDEFISKTIDYYNKGDYLTISKICSQGYELEYIQSKTRAFEQTVKKYSFHKTGVKANSNIDSVCEYYVSFICKFSRNSNTGVISSPDSELILDYAVFTNYTGWIGFGEHGSSVQSIGSNYVVFRYNFNIKATINHGIGTSNVIFNGESGTKKLYAKDAN